MIELRWLLNKNFPKGIQAPLEAYNLQYRNVIVQVHQGKITDASEWSEWKDVPYVDERE